MEGQQLPNLQQSQLPPQQQQPLITNICGPPPTTSVTTVVSPIPNPAPNVVTIPVPISSSSEDIYTYVAVKGSLHDSNSSVFGLNREEIIALSKRFNNASEIVNGYMIKGYPLEVINSLSKLGYKVVCSTGEAEIVWTLQREI